MDLSPGVVIGSRYRLDRQVGQGGIGSVWAATHLVTRRPVAMKFLRGAARESPELCRRLVREARAASAVGHPNVIEVFDVFELEDRTPVLVMDLLEGETLRAKIARDGALTLEQTATLLLPVVSAVGATHARGVVHRDLKPDNVFLSRAADGAIDVKVLDFGIAKFSMDEGEIGHSFVTKAGSTLGTPCYMAPEQAAAEKDLDHRVDVWALGVVLYECLSGVRPIDGESIGQVVTRLLTTGITPLERLVLDLPEDVTRLVGRMLSRERNRRPESVQEVYDVLSRHTSASAPTFATPNAELVERPEESSLPTLLSTHRDDADGSPPRQPVEPGSAAEHPLALPRAARAIGWKGAIGLALSVMAAALFVQSTSSPSVREAQRLPEVARLASDPAEALPSVPVPAAAPGATSADAAGSARATLLPPAPSRQSQPAATSAAVRAPGSEARPVGSQTAPTVQKPPQPPDRFQGGLAEQPPF